MTDLYVQARQRLVDWLKRQLIGPAEGAEKEILRMSPRDRYPVGVLHPLMSEERGTDPASETVSDGNGAADAFLMPDDPLSLADEGDESDEEEPRDGEPGAAARTARSTSQNRRPRYVPPSSVGFSFCVRGQAKLLVTAGAVVYEDASREQGHGGQDADEDATHGLTGRDERGRFRTRYRRRSLLEPEIEYSGSESKRVPIWDGRAGVDIRARSHRAGSIVTVTLFNARALTSLRGRPGVIERAEKALFEASLECSVEGGELVEYPRRDPSLLTDEERELELQYREHRIFAVGHGAAVDWEVTPGEPPRICSDFLPRAETPIVSVAPRGDAKALEMSRLAAAEPPLERLRGFVSEYAFWVQERLVESVRMEDEGDQDAALRICERMKQAHERMLCGVEMLAGDPDAALAFRLANQAMLRQMARFRGEQDEPWAWRPFQLGFLLATIESTVHERDDHRSVLDLIWFQTGGGKTEAYLGLIAFLLVWRRLRYGEAGGGTAAFMRYTLRLLTRQQFERAAGLICALELLRREDVETRGRLGEEPFSVGIWVGAGVCPNRIRDAADIVEQIRAGGGDDKLPSSLLLTRCPWCSEPFDSDHGYEATYPDFRFHCTNPGCEFGQVHDPLPCRVVDESLYEHPPSLLIATIDKFARFAWEERAGRFFGAGRNRRPPDLVIQDELHLISGPLGSVAGLYEAGIETAIRCRGVEPKYIASTATIRMASEQVRALYGREVAVFPPPGLSCDDSWFARVDRRRPGRLYVGYLAPLKDQRHCLAPLAASLVAAPLVAFRDHADREDLLEAWWTNVVYHGSLRGVGTSMNAFGSDVREFGERLVAEYEARRDSGGAGGEPSVDGAEPDRYGTVGSPEGAGASSRIDPVERELRRRFHETQVEQLWSRHTSEQIAETFERLGEPRGSERCLDAVLSTNMVSVGLDVSRLALMVVNGQPLTTGEYVQATSRVGRGDAPGVVVANYYRHQARSLSHYERFRPYHESFYRFVEPSSVTPFTFQVRDRALHAALVIALRHACNGLAPNKAAGSFDPESPEVLRVVAALKRRVRRACRDKAAEVEDHIDRRLEEWREEVDRCRGSAQGLLYQSRDKAYARLLYSYGDGLSAPKLWPTLHSMRNVESPALLGMR